VGIVVVVVGGEFDDFSTNGFFENVGIIQWTRNMILTKRRIPKFDTGSVGLLNDKE